MIKFTQELCKASRALLNWTAAELSEASSIPVDTLRSFESGRTKALSRDNEILVVQALESAGIQFLETGDPAIGPGVAMNGPTEADGEDQ